MNESNSQQVCSGPVLTLNLYGSLSGGKLQTCFQSNKSGEGYDEEDLADMVCIGSTMNKQRNKTCSFMKSNKMNHSDTGKFSS